MIANALSDAPPLDRAGMGRDRYPFNEIASSDAVQAVVETIVRRRIPGNPWIDAHRALCKTDQTGAGYGAFSDAFRDVAFLVGVDYALRSLPPWCVAVNARPEDHRKFIGLIVESMLEVDGKGGAR